MEPRRWLGNRLAAPAAGLVADGLDHFPLPRHHLQRLGDILAQLGELAAAARAGARRGDHDALAADALAAARGPASCAKLTTEVVLVGAIAVSTVSSSSSRNPIWSSRRRPRTDDWPYRSRSIFAIESFRCATIASAPDARASAC
jgi:hypothetical protein